MPDAIRTADEHFEALPDFPFEPRYREWEGLRLAHIDEGPRDGPVVVLFHGEPTWSFLWRHAIPPLVAAGNRCVAPDLPGFGRSDKPTEIGWYSYDRHVAAVAALLDDLDVRAATFVVHDWGGPIGLRIAVEQPQRCARTVVMDTGVFTGHQRMTETWEAFAAFVARNEDLPVGFLVQGGAHTDLPPEVVAAYEAPFPEQAAKAGARAFPLLIPRTPDAPGADTGRRVLDALRADERPMLLLWGEHDPVLPPSTGERLAAAFGRPAPEPVPGAGHFLQEDAGAALGERIARWLADGR